MEEFDGRNSRQIKRGFDLMPGWQDSSEGTNKSKLRYLKDFLEEHQYPLDGSTKLLEVGSGNAGLLDMLNKNGISAVGLDIAPRGSQDSPQVLGRIERMPFQDDSFDIVFSAQALDAHMYNQDQNAMLAEIARVLRSGGYFLAFGDEISVPFPETLKEVEGRDSDISPVYKKE